jgi:integrase
MKGDGVYKRPKSPFWYYKQQNGRLPEGEIARWAFERAASHYLETDAALRLRESSLKKEAFFLVRPTQLLGKVHCDRITAVHIQQLQSSMKNDGCKNTYNNLVLGATGRVLKLAKVWRRIRDDVKRLSEKDNKPVARVLEQDEKLRLFDAARSNPNWETAYAAALIAASTTARGADLRSLRWSDVDLFEGVVSIPDSKTEAGKRRIPLNPDAMLGFRLLLDRASTLGIANSSSYVFPACENGHFDATRPQKTWRTSWRNLTKIAGLKGLRFHDLRHQCITELLEAGAPEAAVLSIAGHVSRKMMEHYSHIRMEAKRKAIAGLASVAVPDAQPALETTNSRVN